jgi:hypothetical protein
MSGGWAAEYDRRVAAGARTRPAGDLGNYQVQDDRGNWFHRAPGNIDCPCGRDANGNRVDPWIAAPAEAFEWINGHYVPFWRLDEARAEQAAELAECAMCQHPRGMHRTAWMRARCEQWDCGCEHYIAPAEQAAELARAEAAALIEPEPAPALYLVAPEPDYPSPTGVPGQVTRAS